MIIKIYYIKQESIVNDIDKHHYDKVTRRKPKTKKSENQNRKKSQTKNKKGENQKPKKAKTNNKV